MAEHPSKQEAIPSADRILQRAEDIEAEIRAYGDLVRDSVPFSLGIPTYERWADLVRDLVSLLSAREQEIRGLIKEWRETAGPTYRSDAALMVFDEALRSCADQLEQLLSPSIPETAGSDQASIEKRGGPITTENHPWRR